MQIKVRNHALMPIISICMIFCFAASVLANDKHHVTSLTGQQFIALQLKQMSPAQRKEAIWAYARHQNYIYSLELWEIPDPLIILDAVLQSPEPYTTAMLDALEHSLPFFTDNIRQVNAAAILYRYHRIMGEDYLRRELLKNSNPLAASIFALNQETSLLPKIIVIHANSRI